MAGKPLGKVPMTATMRQRRWRAKVRRQKLLDRNRNLGLTARQGRFCEEYLLDFNATAAALRAGYSPKAAEVTGWRLLRSARIDQAIQVEIQARRSRLRIDADRIVEEYARVAFANARDFVPRQGEELDLRRLRADQTAAIENVAIETVTDAATGNVCRRLHLQLFNKISALNSLARHLGLCAERHVGAQIMTAAERLRRVDELRRKARDVYLPLYEQALAAGARAPHPIFDACPEAIPAAANDNGIQQADGTEYVGVVGELH